MRIYQSTMPCQSAPSTRSSTRPMTTSSSSITPSDSISEVASDTTTTARSSWVWQYFAQEDQNGVKKNFCRASRGFIDALNPSEDHETPAGICNVALAIDKYASTKSMIRHLSRAHHIEPPIQTGQPTVAAFYIDGEPVQVSLNFGV